MRRQFKPTGRLTKGPSMYRKWSEWDIGDILVAKYTGTQEDKKYGKLGRVCEVLEADFKDGTGGEYEGKTLTLNQTGKLHKALDNQEFGIIFQLEFKGKTEISAGPYKGEEANDMEILLGEIGDDDEVEL